MSISYDRDFAGWALEQAALLERRQFEALDIPNLVEEIQGLAKSERRELASCLRTLLEHLLKLAVAADRLPQDLARAGRGWRLTCRTQRRLTAKVLRENPSLRRDVPGELAEAYEIARDHAAEALGLDEEALPPQCPWSVTEILDMDFWPEERAQ